MNFIQEQIGVQSFEIVRDRIGEILKSELDNQASTYSDEDLSFTVFSDRFFPFDKEDVPCINIVFFETDYDNHNTISLDGNHQFIIDVYLKAKATEENPYGDSNASRLLHKAIGTVIAILENPRYRTLGIPPPSISSTKISKVRVEQPDTKMEGTHIIMGRILFDVRICQGTILKEGNLIEGYQTNVCLESSDRGYIFSQSNE